MRIVSLIPSATEALATLGLADSLVGITHSCDHPPGLSAQRVTSTFIPADASSGKIDELVKESVRSGRPLYDLDTTLLEALDPDLVVTQSVCDVCAVGEGQTMAGLEGLAIRPRVVSLHPHRLDDVLKDFIRLGEAAAVPHRAAAVVTELRDRIAAVQTRVEVLDPRSVVVLEWIDPLFSAGHWTPEIVTLAGGRELLAQAGHRSRELGWAEVRAADPEVLVLACCGLDVPRTLTDLKHLAARPGYEGLRAVRAGNVFVADGGAHFSRPGPRLVESLELLAETLHPSGRPGARALPKAGSAR